MSDLLRVVFDCNVFLQAMISSRGPAAALLGKVEEGGFLLFVSDQVIEEAREVGKRPFVQRKYGVRPEQVDAFLEDIKSRAVSVIDVKHVFDHPIDPDDSHYVDLAVAVGATRIVSRDNHLLSLMDQGRQEGRDFRSRFATLMVLDPAAFLVEIRTSVERNQT